LKTFAGYGVIEASPFTEFRRGQIQRETENFWLLWKKLAFFSMRT
jgi:hypothetical protein